MKAPKVKLPKPRDCDRILEALAVASVIASLYTCSAPVGIFTAPVAIYCLIYKHKQEED